VIVMVTGDEGEGAMTRKTAFITVVATALVLVAPAWGAVDPSQGSGLAQTDAHERAFAVQQNSFPAGDDHVLIQSESSTTPYLDAHERGLAIGRQQMVPVDASAPAVATTGVISGDDHVRIDPADLPVSVPSTSSGRELEWPQVGLGLGLGLALAFGLFLTVRHTRARPLAH
jgi:hypothetical protein